MEEVKVSSKITTKEKVITDWECQLIISPELYKIRGQQKLGKHYQYDERLVLVTRTTKHQVKII